MTNKTQEVEKYLKLTGNITSLDAIKLFGATRLSAIIFKLRKRGYNIYSRKEETTDRYGNNCRYVRYIYLGEVDSSKEEKNAISLVACLKKMFGVENARKK